MKLLLINPRSSRRSGLNLHNGGHFQPLSLATIAGSTPNFCDIIVEDENWHSATLRTDIDLVALTAFTSSSPRAYELAKYYKEIKIPTIIGGVHASIMKEEASYFCDSVVIGESDNIWSYIINDAEKKILRKYYQCEPPNNFSIPNRKVLDPKYVYGSIQITRGCPFDCDFCSIPNFSGRKIRKQSIENTIGDLYNINNKGIFFVDDNLVGYTESQYDYLKILLKEMICCGFNKRWICQCSINICEQKEILKLMYDAGCRMIMIGIEGDDKAGLASVNKKLNMRQSKYDFSAIHDAGISVMGFFILGLETDTKESMENRIETIHTCGIDAWQITILTPLPGTRLFQRLKEKEKLLYTNFPNDWGNYDFVDVTFIPDSFNSLEEFRKCVQNCIKKGYDSKIIEQTSRRTQKETNLESTVMSTAALLKYQKIALSRLKEENS